MTTVLIEPRQGLIEELTLGQRLLALRRYRRLTQIQLSQTSGVSVAVISRIENEHTTNPDWRCMAALARAMQLSLDNFMVDEQN